MKARRDKVIKFSNDTLALCLVILIACRMPRANIAEVLRIGLVKVRWVDPQLVKNTECTTKLIKVFGMVLKRVRRACSRSWGACTRNRARGEFAKLQPVLGVLKLKFL